MVARTTPWWGGGAHAQTAPPHPPVAGTRAWRPTSRREHQCTTRGDLCRRLAHLKFGPRRDTKGIATMPGRRAARRRLPGPKKQHLAPFGGCSASTMKVFWCPGVTWMFGVSVGRRWFWAGNSASSASRALTAVPGVLLPLTPVASPIRWTLSLKTHSSHLTRRSSQCVVPNSSLLMIDLSCFVLSCSVLFGASRGEEQVKAKRCLALRGYYLASNAPPRTQIHHEEQSLPPVGAFEVRHGKGHEGTCDHASATGSQAPPPGPPKTAFGTVWWLFGVHHEGILVAWGHLDFRVFGRPQVVFGRPDPPPMFR